MTPSQEEDSAKGWWRTATLTLVAVLVSFGGFWMTEGRHLVTRTEVGQIVTQEQQLYDLRLKTIELDMKTIEQDIRNIESDISSIESGIQVLIERIGGY